MVADSGDVPMPGWTVDWSLPAGQKVADLWNGTAAYAGRDVMVHNAGGNGSSSPGRSTRSAAPPGEGDSVTTLPCRVG